MHKYHLKQVKKITKQLHLAEMKKTGILESWILMDIFQNNQKEEHFEQSPAYLDLNAGKLYMLIVH